MSSIFLLAKYKDAASMTSAMDKLGAMKGKTFTANALQKAADTLQHAGSRADAKKVILLITDGQNDGRTEPSEVADKIRKEHGVIINGE